MLFKKREKILQEKVEILIKKIDESNLKELIYILGSKKQIIIRNIIAGIFRGVGIGIGITLITAILVYFLRKIVALNIPVIGEYISDIVEIVEKSSTIH